MWLKKFISSFFLKAILVYYVKFKVLVFNTIYCTYGNIKIH